MNLKESASRAYFAEPTFQGDFLELNPREATLTTNTIQDPSAPNGLEFQFADGARPLATPWQVAVERAKMIRKIGLPDGIILDPACGSGIQLSAYCSMLSRKGIGIELDEETANAACANLARVAKHGFGENLLELRIFLADGTKTGTQYKVALLHLDPARPRNSRTHDLDEMQPSIGSVLSAWKDSLQTTEKGPAILLDLSPRLTDKQRTEVEEIVDTFWPSVGKTWVWTSRGGGRIDRLSLWIGQISLIGVSRRFVRIPPDFKVKPLILDGEYVEITQQRKLPRRGDYVTILDSALVESGLAHIFVSNATSGQESNYSVISGRRPQLHHSGEFEIKTDTENLLIQASGKIVKLIHCELTEDELPAIIEVAREFGFGKLTIRVPVSPDLHPKLQGSLDRQLAATGGRHTGFLAKQPEDKMLLLCLE